MQKRLTQQTKRKLQTVIKLLREAGHELKEAKPFWSRLCFSLAAAFEDALAEHFKHFEFDSPSRSHTYLTWHDKSGHRQAEHIWYTATFTIEPDA